MSHQYTAYPFQGDAPLDEALEWAALANRRGSPHRVFSRGQQPAPAASPGEAHVRRREPLSAIRRGRLASWWRSIPSFRTRFGGTVAWSSSSSRAKPGGYFNFEINCGGALLSYYIEDPTRTADGFAKFTRLSAEHGRRIRITHSLPSLVVPEHKGPKVWQIGCAIPLDVLEAYAGPLGPLSGQTWRGNFFKCADDSSHPHWASWARDRRGVEFSSTAVFW